MTADTFFLACGLDHARLVLVWFIVGSRDDPPKMENPAGRAKFGGPSGFGGFSATSGSFTPTQQAQEKKAKSERRSVLHEAKSYHCDPDCPPSDGSVLE
jgi:hypothetical protein